jgi:RNA polymerase sigma factor (sigma-70 family)
MVLRVCRRVLNHEQDAEDAFQATFLILARKTRSIRKREALASWLHGVAYRTAMKLKRGAARRRNHETRRWALVSRAAVSPSWDDVQSILDEEIQRLPEALRTAFVLCVLEGKSAPAAARELGIKEGTVGSRLTRARQRLQKRLIRRGIKLAALLAALSVAESAASAAVPTVLAHATLRSGLLVASGGTAAGVIPAHVAALAAEAGRAMLLTKIKISIAVLIAVGSIAGVGTSDLGGRAMRHLQSRFLLTMLLAAPLDQSPGAQPPPAAPMPPTRTDSFGDPLPPGALVRVGSVRLRHGSVVTGLAYSSDGKILVSSSWDHTVRVWEAATGKELRTLTHQARLLSVAVSPDGKRVASGGPGVSLWDVESGKQVKTLMPNVSVPAVAFSKDGKTLAFASDRSVLLYDPDSGGDMVRQFDGHTQPVTALAFSADSKVLASASSDETVRLWQVASGKELHRFEGHRGGVLAVALSPDGKLLASGGGDSSVRLWDTASGAELRQCQGHAGAVRTLSFSADGKTLVSGTAGGDRTIRLWNPATGKELRTLTGGMLASAVFSPDGKTLALSRGESAIRLCDPATGKERPPSTELKGILRLACSPDGKLLAAAGLFLDLLDARTGRSIRSLDGHRTGVYAVSFSPDGQLLASGGRDGTVRLWDVATGKESRRLQGDADESAIPAHWINSLAFAPDGRLLADGRRDGRIRIWDVAAATEVRQFGGDQGSIWSLAFAPDGKLLATANADRSVRLWDPATGNEVRQLRGHEGEVEGVAFSPDGRLLASGGHDGTVRLWKVATGQQLRQLAEPSGWTVRSGHHRDGRQIRFAPDGRALACGTWGGMQLWEVATGAERARFMGHRGDVAGVAFVPHAPVIASGSFDGTIVLWDLTGRRLSDHPLAVSLKLQELESAWRDLTVDDAGKAYQALWTLALAPQQSVPFLEQHLRPAAALDDKRIAQLIAALDDDAFDKREKATEELAKLGGGTAPALRKALAGSASAEQRQRLEDLLAKLINVAPSRDQIRALRALEVLEEAGTPQARHLLETLARGQADADLTQEAKASLQRLTGSH